MISPKDKTDIIYAMRQVADGLETGRGNTRDLIQAIATEMLVIALKDGPLLDEITGENASPLLAHKREEALEMLIRVEIAAIADSIATLHHHRIREIDILTERLVRQFDPAIAWNEAINRAIVAKKAKGEAILEMTPPQKFMFETLQVPTTMKALRSA